MTVTEQARHRMHTHLEEIMGEEHAAALMEWAPSGPIASTHDIDRLRADVEQQFAHLGEIMDTRFAAMEWRFEAMDSRFESVDTRFESMDLRMATKEDLAGLRVEMAGLRGEMANLRAELYNTIRLHTIVLVGAMGAMISAARIF